MMFVAWDEILLPALFQLCGCSSFVLVHFGSWFCLPELCHLLLACLRRSPSFACHCFRHSVSVSFLSSCIFFYCPFSVPCASRTMLRGRLGSLGGYLYCLVYYKPGSCHFPLFIRDIYFTLPPSSPTWPVPSSISCCLKHVLYVWAYQTQQEMWPKPTCATVLAAVLGAWSRYFLLLMVPLP